mgnify:FL=1|jgi:hypothetical protein|tara:strand:- start:310 stop:654 length:345 start_codon:yes stop_codon:yes gene_type:complete
MEKKKELPVYFRELREFNPNMANVARSVYMTLPKQKQAKMMSDYNTRVSNYRKMDASGKKNYQSYLTTEYQKYGAKKPEDQQKFVSDYTTKLNEGGLARGQGIAIRGFGFKGVR